MIVILNAYYLYYYLASYNKQVYLKIYNQYTVIDWVQGQQLLLEEPVYN